MATKRSVRTQKFLVDYLINNGLLDQKSAIEAARAAKSEGIPLAIYFLQNDILESRKVATAVARCFEIPLYDLTAHNLDLIPKELLNFDYVKKKYGLPLLKRGDKLIIGIVEPNIAELRNISFLTCMNVEFILVEADKVQEITDKMSSASGLTTKETTSQREGKKKLPEENVTAEEFVASISGEFISEEEDIKIKTFEEEQQEVLSVDDINDTPVVRFVNRVLIDATKTKSSDIHFEPYEKICRVRYRQDGILQEIVSAPKRMANSIVARLKVMANLDISEHRKPQDGRFRLIIAEGEGVDIRISTCPTMKGEKVVMRILDPSMGNLDITQLGMDDTQKENFLKAIQQPQGMILVTGPTGSGKTVTLYTALRMLNTIEVNISTIEDPVEIYMEGINQVQVNQKVGLDFSSALRSFLRQDPDIIMVGEIRDLETGEVAVKAAQTGHLVLSTLHTNNAPQTITRLESMGIKPYNIASSISLVMAQRLVRRLCPKCKKKVENPELLLKEFGVDVPEGDLEIFEPQGCSYCTQGYKGRIGIYEVMPITKEMNEAILKGESAIELAKLAKEQGFLSLRESGVNHVLRGITSLDEINQATI